MSRRKVTRKEMLQAALKDPEFRARWHNAGARLQVSELIASIRTEEGLTQAALAIKAGKTRQYIGMLEGGGVNVSVDMLEKILGVMGYALVLRGEKLVAGGAE